MEEPKVDMEVVESRKRGEGDAEAASRTDNRDRVRKDEMQEGSRTHSREGTGPLNG